MGNLRTAGGFNPQNDRWSCPLLPGQSPGQAPGLPVGARAPSPEALGTALHSSGFPDFPSVNTKPRPGLTCHCFVPEFMAQIREAAQSWVGWEEQGLPLTN